MESAITKFINFTNPTTTCKYNFTLAPDPLATIFTVPNIDSKYGKDYVKYSECTLEEFQDNVPKQFLKFIDQHFKQYIIYMYLEVGTNGLRHYHGQLISTEPALTEMYINDLIGRVAFQFTGRFRSTKVLQNHPCLRIYLNNDKWEPTGNYKTYEEYISKQSTTYFVDAKFISKYYQDRWLKLKSINIRRTFYTLIAFINNNKYKVTKANTDIAKLSAAYKAKQDPQLQILLNLKKMFKNEDIKITISTEDLDKIL